MLKITVYELKIDNTLNILDFLSLPYLTVLHAQCCFLWPAQPAVPALSLVLIQIAFSPTANTGDIYLFFKKRPKT